MATHRVAVVGAGTMGQGIAQVAALAGFSTTLVDARREAAEAAHRAIVAQLARLVEKGKLSAEARAAAEARLTPTHTLEEACAGATVVLESVPEQLDLKATVLRAAAAVAEPSALLASNTSSLSITELGQKVGAPGRVLGLHFFNPAPVMELVELVVGLATDDATLDLGLAFTRSLGKTPIVVRDTPGFATSRLGVLLGAEAIRMLETGVAAAEDIDRGMELGYRHPMGPLKLTDLVGLDVRLAILEHLQSEIGEQFRPPPLLRTMVRAGKLGKKTGEGFYVWKDGVAVPKSRK